MRSVVHRASVDRAREGRRELDDCRLGQLALTQQFQMLSGTLGTTPIAEGRLRGDCHQLSPSTACSTKGASTATRSRATAGGKPWTARASVEASDHDPWPRLSRSSCCWRSARRSRRRSDAPELRALWVDAFHEGIRSAREADDLVAAAKRANLNTLFVQVRRRGDALYTKGVEPPLDDPAYDPSFDALADIVEAGPPGRAPGARVGERDAGVARRGAAARSAPRLQPHGPSASRRRELVHRGPDRRPQVPRRATSSIPGHPAAAAYLAGIYVDIVRNYAVDGIHFDYVRYPETDERLPHGAGVGYNAVNLARFQRATGRTDMPPPGDEAWMAVAARPGDEPRAARVDRGQGDQSARSRSARRSFPWGQPPTSEKDFVDRRTDAAHLPGLAPVAEGRLARPWRADELRQRDRRPRARLVQRLDRVGETACARAPARRRPRCVSQHAQRHTLAQIGRVRAADDGHRVAGVSFFSYAVPTLPPATPPKALNRSRRPCR